MTTRIAPPFPADDGNRRSLWRWGDRLSFWYRKIVSAEAHEREARESVRAAMAASVRYA